jgi:hypothetical protein
MEFVWICGGEREGMLLCFERRKNFYYGSIVHRVLCGSWVGLMLNIEVNVM